MLLLILLAISILVFNNNKNKVENFGLIKKIGKSTKKAGKSVGKAAKDTGKGISKAAKDTANAAKKTAEAAKKAAESLAKFIVNLLKDALASVVKAAKVILDGMVKGIVGIFGGFIKIIFLIVPEIFGTLFKISGKLWEVITNIAPFLKLLPFLMFMNLMLPLIIPVVCIALALGVFMGPTIPYMLPLIWSVFLFFYFQYKITQTVNKLGKIDWEKEVKKLMSGKALEDIIKTIGKGIGLLFKKIKF